MILHGSTEFYSNNKFIKLSDLNDGDTITLYDKDRTSLQAVVYKRNERKQYTKYHFENGYGNSYDLMVTAKNEWDTYDFTNGNKMYVGRSLAVQPQYEDNMLINVKDYHYFFLGCIMSNWGRYKKDTPDTIQFYMDSFNFWKYQRLFEDNGFYNVMTTYKRGYKVCIIEKTASQHEIERTIEEIRNYKNLNPAQKADMFFGYYTCRCLKLQHIIKENERFAAGFVEECYRNTGFWVTNIRYVSSVPVKQANDKSYYEITFDHKEGEPFDDTLSKTMVNRWTIKSIEDPIPDNNTYDVYLIGPGSLANGIMVKYGIILYLNYDEEGNLDWDFGNINGGIEPPSPDDEVIDFSNISGDGNPVYDNMIWEMGNIEDGVTPPPPDTDDYEFADSGYIPPTEDNFDYDFNLIYNMENMEPIDNTPDDQKYDFSDITRLKENIDVFWDFDDIDDGVEDHGPSDEIEDFDDINDGLVPSGGDDDEMYDFNREY